jgi:hypothetical protein
MTPTTALLWGLWRQHRWTIAAIAGLTAAGHVLHARDVSSTIADGPSPPVVLLAMAAFLMLLGVFNYTEAADDRGLGQFPKRLYTLPITSLRLVMVPILAGIASIEVLYLLWMVPMARGGPIFSPFVALLLAATVVFYLSALWSLERAGALRLVVLGAIIVFVFAISVLPSFPPAPPPWWRSETSLSAMVALVGLAAALLSWRHVDRLRGGGGTRHALRAEALFTWIADTRSSRRDPFADLSAAQFWFEWRSSGMVLPAVVAGMLLFFILPMSLARTDARNTFLFLLAALATPIVFAIPIGLAFSKPAFWTEDLGVPAFLAVRPISAEEFVATKIKVAAASALASWLIVVAFAAAWMSLWGNHDNVVRLALQLWAFHGQSTITVYGIAVLAVAAGVALTWRLLVSRLWSGLAGIRILLVGAVTSMIIIVIIALGSDELREWFVEDSGRIALLPWFASAAVVAKYWTAAFTWRRVPHRYLRAYAWLWLPATMVLLAASLVVWNMVRIYAALDADRLFGIIVLVVLLAVPLARIGLAPSTFAQNRHRS